MKKLTITFAIVLISLTSVFANGSVKNDRPERRVSIEAQIIKLEKKIENKTREMNGFIAANEDWRAREGFNHKQVNTAEKTEKMFSKEINKLEVRLEKLR